MHISSAKKRNNVEHFHIVRFLKFAFSHSTPKTSSKIRQFKIRILEDKLSHSHMHTHTSNAIDNGNSECQRWVTAASATAARRFLGSCQIAARLALHLNAHKAICIAIQGFIHFYLNIDTCTPKHTCFYVHIYVFCYVEICTFTCETLDMSLSISTRSRNSNHEYWNYSLR